MGKTMVLVLAKIGETLGFRHFTSQCIQKKWFAETEGVGCRHVDD